jgi:hypothetical protein
LRALSLPPSTPSVHEHPAEFTITYTLRALRRQLRLMRGIKRE